MNAFSAPFFVAYFFGHTSFTLYSAVPAIPGASSTTSAPPPPLNCHTFGFIVSAGRVADAVCCPVTGAAVAPTKPDQTRPEQTRAELSRAEQTQPESQPHLGRSNCIAADKRVGVPIAVSCPVEAHC